MMTVLHLTAEEQRIFSMLPENVRAGWSVQPIRSLVPETTDDLVMRYRIAHFREPFAQKFAEAAKSARSPDDFARLASQLDVSVISAEGWAEIFFVLGTKITSYFMRYLLLHAKDDEDLEGIAALSLIRNCLADTQSGSPPS